ncbi:hypothetical protein GGX14DRAFT_557271 [Mycena pura]|uniref:Uncharacterized protein n=1 Tax=Mycena pura TaxID=153505 RepID=A0AAD7E237_9AGAR|nr:hypothetical protein GGX14DRAFT_557271 [Mycena pura]
MPHRDGIQTEFYFPIATPISTSIVIRLGRLIKVVHGYESESCAGWIRRQLLLLERLVPADFETSQLRLAHTAQSIALVDNHHSAFLQPTDILRLQPETAHAPQVPSSKLSGSRIQRHNVLRHARIEVLTHRGVLDFTQFSLGLPQDDASASDPDELGLPWYVVFDVPAVSMLIFRRLSVLHTYAATRARCHAPRRCLAPCRRLAPPAHAPLSVRGIVLDARCPETPRAGALHRRRTLH